MSEFVQDQTNILDCGHPESPHHSFTTGYGIDKDGKKFCYQCCAEADKDKMIEEGTIWLYIDRDKKIVSNWPGSLKFNALVWHTHHNWWHCEQWYVRFVGPDGKVWSGRNVSSGYNDCILCKRTKLGSIYA